MSMINRETIKKSFPFLMKIVRWMKMRKNELRSLPRHIKRKLARNENARAHHGKIKVVFICQYIPAWSKNRQLYEALRCDDRFETILLCVPNRISSNQLKDPEELSNDTYAYFCERGYEDAINALIGRNEWFDLRAQHPDFVICNRYDRPMPAPYTSSELSKYTKICMILYSGIALLRVDETLFDKQFAANTFCFFAESDGKKRELFRWNRILYKLGLSNAVCCGIPAVENTYLAKQDPCETWDFSRNSFRVIFAPRWTVDPTWGGSSFLKSQKTFFNIVDHHPEIAFLVRPHPLMFDNFVRSGLMTEEDVLAYKEQCILRQNVQIDETKEYHATFWHSSVLVCDFSSIIVEYYVTEKPIIYLAYDAKIEYTEIMRAMLSGCYLVNSEQELVSTLENLAKGEDPLAERRKAVLSHYLIGEGNDAPSENMKRFLLDKYAD